MRFEVDCSYGEYVDHKVILDEAEIAAAMAATSLPKPAFDVVFVYVQVGFEWEVNLSWRDAEGANLSRQQDAARSTYLVPLIEQAWSQRYEQDLDDACRAHAARRGWKLVEAAAKAEEA